MNENETREIDRAQLNAERDYCFPTNAVDRFTHTVAEFREVKELAEALGLSVPEEALVNIQIASICPSEARSYAFAKIRLSEIDDWPDDTKVRVCWFRGESFPDLLHLELVDCRPTVFQPEDEFAYICDLKEGR